MVLTGKMVEERYVIGLRAADLHIRAEPVVKGGGPGPRLSRFHSSSTPIVGTVGSLLCTLDPDF